MISAKTTSRAILVPALILFAACAKNPPAGDPNSKTTDSEGSTTVTSGGTAATSSTTTATQRRPSVETPPPTVNVAGNQPVSQDPSAAAQPAPPAPMSSMSMASGSVTISQDPALVKKGEGVFKSKACTTCHTVGKGRLAGPDLAGVTTRREAAWLQSWLHDPPAVVASGDATATALVAEYKGVKMPNMRLTDADIEALLAYLGAHSGK